jgi:glycerol-3-phosphate acyltransferase PlsY
MISMLLSLKLVLSMFIGYLLGSIPIAVLVSRRRHVDIFTTGSGLAGAANVFRNVGHPHGIIVFSGDIAKGLLAMMIAYQFGIKGVWILLPAVATLTGHWNSIFTGFRGGDGLSTLLGITVAIIPVYGLIGLTIGATVGIIARQTGHHASLWGGGVAYGWLLVLGVTATAENAIPLFGVVLLAILVLTHGVVGHYRGLNPSRDHTESLTP